MGCTYFGQVNLLFWRYFDPFWNLRSSPRVLAPGFTRPTSNFLCVLLILWNIDDCYISRGQNQVPVRLTRWRRFEDVFVCFRGCWTRFFGSNLGEVWGTLARGRFSKWPPKFLFLMFYGSWKQYFWLKRGNCDSLLSAECFCGIIITKNYITLT